jgi:O-antigen/teichoic acid export membrane protein
LWISQYNKLQDFCCYLYVPVSAAVAMLGIVVIKYVFNPETARLMSLPLLFLSVGQLLFGILSVPSWLAIAMKKPGILVKTNLSALFVVVPVTILLTFKFGLRGAAFSAIIYGIWQFVYFVPRFCSECLKISPKIWYMRNLLFIGIGMGIYGFIWFLTYVIGQSLTVGGLVIGYFSGTLIFAVASWFLIGEEIKAAIIRMYKETILCLKMRKAC